MSIGADLFTSSNHINTLLKCIRFLATISVQRCLELRSLELNLQNILFKNRIFIFYTYVTYSVVVLLLNI